VRIRFALTIDITKAQAEADETPNVVEHSGSYVEKAEPHPIGFVIEPYRSDPFEEKAP
jgi:hypothetical protein